MPGKPNGLIMQAHKCQKQHRQDFGHETPLILPCGPAIDIPQVVPAIAINLCGAADTYSS